MFRSLAFFNYRLWFSGAIVSNIGTWMQRTAQDWIVLTVLTDNDAAAVGVTMALQLGPPLLMVPWTGFIADRFNLRKLLMTTQGSMGVLGLGLGALILSGHAQLWHVYIFALLLGFVSAVDSPARQTFVSELVERENLTNAVALNSASFNAARMMGPAVAGGLMAVIGAGWVFIINAVSFLAVLTSLRFLRMSELHQMKRAQRGHGEVLEGFRYVAKRPDILIILVVIFLVGTFGLNFPIFTSTMASTEFHKGAGAYGLLSSVMAIGSVIGALWAARRERPRLRLVFGAAAGFGVACAIAAFMPNYWTFAASLVLIGMSAITLTTSANATVQMTTEPAMRGRVMALYMAIFMGGTPIGAPIVGWVANAFGPRWALGVGAAAGIVAAVVGVVFVFKHQHIHIRYRTGVRPRLALQRTPDPDSQERQAATDQLAIQETTSRRT
ncbi:MFS transporter [Spelaeicoccus albus]|uniref:MFS family permease n=1 Tax=Spelaeicoccus albus TaxID=1280376 RepID=A0A7Z0A7L8_9MICO|nr:MFS transporter [Spelaeicoccus albus]NYI65909.1 MFS family permease [Spelaeicoccus albus]